MDEISGSSLTHVSFQRSVKIQWILNSRVAYAGKFEYSICKTYEWIHLKGLSVQN